jgi:hypothetical protein
MVDDNWWWLMMIELMMTGGNWWYVLFCLMTYIATTCNYKYISACSFLLVTYDRFIMLVVLLVKLLIDNIAAKHHE